MHLWQWAASSRSWDPHGTSWSKIVCSQHRTSHDFCEPALKTVTSFYVWHLDTDSFIDDNKSESEDAGDLLVSHMLLMKVFHQNESDVDLTWHSVIQCAHEHALNSTCIKVEQPSLKPKRIYDTDEPLWEVPCTLHITCHCRTDKLTSLSAGQSWGNSCLQYHEVVAARWNPYKWRIICDWTCHPPWLNFHRSTIIGGCKEDYCQSLLPYSKQNQTGS